jgi:hypothetical protein
MKKRHNCQQHIPTHQAHTSSVHQFKQMPFDRTTVTELLLNCVAPEMKKDRMAFTKAPMNKLWFHIFYQGCHVRMGDDFRPDRALIIELMLAMQKEYGTLLNLCQSVKEILDNCLHAAFIICTVVSVVVYGGGLPLISWMLQGYFI